MADALKTSRVGVAGQVLAALTLANLILMSPMTRNFSPGPDEDVAA